MPLGLPGMGRSPGVLLVPGVGASFLGVGVLDLRPGVEDLSFWGEKGWKTRDELQLPGSRVPAPVTPQKGRTWPRSLVLEEGVLLEEATEAGLLGASPFFSPRALSRPFSGGEWAGLTRGVAGSCGMGKVLEFPQREGLPPAPPSGRCWEAPKESLPTSQTHTMSHPGLTSLETSTTRSSLLSPSLSWNTKRVTPCRELQKLG